MKKEDVVIQVDTREQSRGNCEIIDYFNRNGVKHLRSKLYVGDYTLLHKQDICIDKKADLMEMANCMHKDHIRFRAECDRAKQNNIKLYILIQDEYIYNLDGVKYYKIPVYKNNQYKILNGVRILHKKRGEKRANFDCEVLEKAMKTFEERHGCKFIFCKKENTGEKILELLGVETNGEK